MCSHVEPVQRTQFGMGISVFTPAPKPLNEFSRSRAAAEWARDISADLPRLTRISHEAKAIFDVRWSGVSAIVEDWQHVIASSGGMLGLYRRSTSLSSYVITSPEKPFCVRNAIENECFDGNPFVEDGLIGFYAGAAIFDAAGLAVGVLCVTHPQPLEIIPPDALEMLQSLARSVTPNVLLRPPVPE
jgi:GAF domain-containing protein